MSNKKSDYPGLEHGRILRNYTACLRKQRLYGRVFNRLTVLNIPPVFRNNSLWWLCVCVCGRLSEAAHFSLLGGQRSSCGCLLREKTIARNKSKVKTHCKHGHMITLVGRTNDGGCKACYRTFYLKRRFERQAILNSYKPSVCPDCRLTLPKEVMEFDHRENKSFNVTDMHTKVSEAILRLEISKCDVVCANCHKKRTDARRNHSERNLTN